MKKEEIKCFLLIIGGIAGTALISFIIGKYSHPGFGVLAFIFLATVLIMFFCSKIDTEDMGHHW
jgi:hypothetical protein